MSNGMVMDLISLKFIVFVICVVFTCVVVPQKYKWVVVGLASFYFYWGVGKRALLTLVIITLFTYAVAMIIDNESIPKRTKKIVFVSSLVLIVGWLLTIKSCAYWGKDFYWLIFPLGASYITFSLISYLVDVYMKREHAESNICKFLVFSLCFLKITQGPISRYSNIKKSLFSSEKISLKKVSYGCQRMIFGYFKKLVVADRIAMFTDNLFAEIDAYSGSIIVVGTTLAAFQLYCDFSGYMDIMIGFAEMIGVNLEENFKHPFFSRGTAEFWRRWHITLGTWFKDYVYTPLVMSRWVKSVGKWGRKTIGKRFGNSLMKIIALSAVWLFTGLWHGTGVNYIIWGIYWGAIIIISTIFEEELTKLIEILKINTDCFSWRLFQSLRTFVIFSGGILITRVGNLYDIRIAIYKIFKEYTFVNLLDNSLFEIGMNRIDFQIVTISMLVVMLISAIEERESVRDIIARQNIPVRWMIYVMSVSLILLIGIYGTEYSSVGFAYTNF